jgi:apolipoprotein N-acyltransferase
VTRRALSQALAANSAGAARAAPAAAVVSGVLWFVSCADYDIWPLAWIAMVPALWAIEAAPTRRQALAWGWLAGLVANLGGFYWVAGLLVRFGHLPLAVGLLGLVLLCAYQAVVFLLFAWAVRSLRRISRDRRGAPLPMALIAPVAMVCFELLVPFIFPWYLAITQAWVTPVIQIAELTGPLGVTALLLAANGAVYDALVERERRRRLMPAAAVAGVLLAAIGFGVLRMAQTDAARQRAPSALIGVVQGNIPFDEKGLKRGDLAASQLRDQQRQSAALERGEIAGRDRFGTLLPPGRGADLIVWTESSYPYSLPRQLTEPHRGGTDLPADHPQAIRSGFSAPLMFGAITRDYEQPEDYPWNTALMIDKSGRFVGRFDKNFLLMFGEYVPGLETFDFVKDLAPAATSHFHRGTDVAVFPFAHDGQQYRLGPLICYEDILPDFGRRLYAHRPHLLVNLTNDAWFGDTSEPWQHLALSVYRAVEARTDLVRAVNTGVSAFVDAAGRVYAKSYAMDPGIEDKGACDRGCPGGYSCQQQRCRPKGADSLLAEVALIAGGDTVFARLGNLFGWLCALLTFAGWIAWPRWTRA